jgi:FSR family fosmidomycin resistance protein-like MFS transporter
MLAVWLGLLHGLADACAGYGLGWILRHETAIATWILLYNGLGFGYQPMVGWLSDRWRIDRQILAGSVWALGVGLLVLPQSTLTGVVLLGLGSASFHVGAGAIVSRLPAVNRAAGCFTAPGVVGLALGGWLGWLSVSWVAIAIAVGLLLASGIGLRWSLPVRRFATEKPSLSSSEQERALALVLTATAVSSFVWTSGQLLYQQDWVTLIYLAIAAAFAKTVGGWVAQRWGWAITLGGAVIGAAVLIALHSVYAPGIWLGVALLQVTVPYFLTQAWALLPRSPSFATGLSLGLAIVLGGIPAMLGLSVLIQQPLWAIALMMIVIGSLMVPSMAR